MARSQIEKVFSSSDVPKARKFRPLNYESIHVLSRARHKKPFYTTMYCTRLSLRVQWLINNLQTDKFPQTMRLLAVVITLLSRPAPLTANRAIPRGDRDLLRLLPILELEIYELVVTTCLRLWFCSLRTRAK